MTWKLKSSYGADLHKFVFATRNVYALHTRFGRKNECPKTPTPDFTALPTGAIQAGVPSPRLRDFDSWETDRTAGMNEEPFGGFLRDHKSASIPHRHGCVRAAAPVVQLVLCAEQANRPIPRPDDW